MYATLNAMDLTHVINGLELKTEYNVKVSKNQSLCQNSKIIPTRSLDTVSKYYV